MSTDYYLVCTECGHECSCMSRKMWGVCINKSAMAAFIRDHMYCDTIVLLDESCVDFGDYTSVWLNRHSEDSDYYDSEKDKLDIRSLHYSDENKIKKEFKTSSHERMESIYIDKIKELELKLEALNNVEDLRSKLQDRDDHIFKLDLILKDISKQNELLKIQQKDLYKQLARHDASIFEAAVQERVKMIIENPPVD